MKGIHIFFSLVLCLLSGVVMASNATDMHKTMMMKHQWICETNASSSTNAADQKADEMMKKGMPGKAAFDMAMKHCRDCDKITCTMQK